MLNRAPHKKHIILSLIIAILLPHYIMAADNAYSSQLTNESNYAGSKGFKLIRSKMWPNAECVVNSGKAILYPGESTELKIKKSKACAESGVGYSIYRMDDTHHQHLLGYISHRLGDGKFSVQISRFCEDKCRFIDLDPKQNRKN